MTPVQALRSSNFGKRTAEDEREQLRQYFVETEQWNRVWNGEIDIVYGSKGSGKSAIYSLIQQSENSLFDKQIIAIPAENPQGAPAFQNLGDDPPYDEFEFVSLWKIYILTLVGQYIREYSIINLDADRFIEQLERAELLPKSFTLAKALRYAFDYVKHLTRVTSIEGGVAFDPNTGMPNGVTGKIALREPSSAQAKLGVVSINEMFVTANNALRSAGYTFWILLDRLDVAFAEKPDLEAAALRALFKCYLDIKAHTSIKTKIFIRTDIWKKITDQGFREASHIERSLTIDWRTDDLINLVVRRALANDAICKFYNVNREEVLASFPEQQRFLTRIFPQQVETGPNKPLTFSWILGRTRDATKTAAPRELIHFLNELRDVQINRLERGMQPPSDHRLFEQISFKEALPQVSKVRLEQTIYAEFPTIRVYVELLREQKATQSINSLRALWKTDAEQTFRIANELEQIGFLERLGSSPNFSWRVPFLYRPALNLLQGTADASITIELEDDDGVSNIPV